MKKAIMNTMIILFALAMCVGCGQSSEQKEESVPTDVTKAEKQEQVQVEAEDEDTLENGEQVRKVKHLHFIAKKSAKIFGLYSRKNVSLHR